ncbi:MAG: hypothetical protein RI972_1347 [Pseudomonadota bacterium]|jgi:flagellar protein FlaG
MSIPISTPVAGQPAEAPRAVPDQGHDRPAAPARVVPAALPKPPAEPAYDPVKLRDTMRQAIEELNRQMKDSGRSLRFAMDETLNTPVVTVRNANTGEVVRQIPNEAAVHVAHTLEMLKGLLYDGSS